MFALICDPVARRSAGRDERSGNVHGDAMPVCLNHPDREASTRCVTCFKPLCSDCVLRSGRKVYCSEECLQNDRRTSGSIGRFAARERAIQRKKLLIKLAVILFVAAALIAGCVYVMRLSGG